MIQRHGFKMHLKVVIMSQKQNFNNLSDVTKAEIQCHKSRDSIT